MRRETIFEIVSPVFPREKRHIADEGQRRFDLMNFPVRANNAQIGASNLIIVRMFESVADDLALNAIDGEFVADIDEILGRELANQRFESPFVMRAVEPLFVRQ
jgi:hypothetical protein